ncbi:hypothetical protein V6N12_071117 [Hibiscus sabdariffa]|uniref:Uncharacterized protein n=1 Tax=Hibiscus sabdariffa TaxID=183260 RepID=A0ABR2FJD5_9ROSI
MGVGSTLDTEYLDGVRCCGWFTWVLLRSSHCCKYQLVPSDASRLHPSALKTKILQVGEDGLGVQVNEDEESTHGEETNGVLTTGLPADTSVAQEASAEDSVASSPVVVDTNTADDGGLDDDGFGDNSEQVVHIGGSSGLIRKSLD